MKASKDSPVSRAARVLGRIRSDRKAAASRENGRLGGRPSSGLCSDRELRRRVHRYCSDHGIPLSPWLSWASSRRRSIVSGGDFNAFLNSQRGTAHSLALLFPREPLLL